MTIIGAMNKIVQKSRIIRNLHGIHDPVTILGVIGEMRAVLDAAEADAKAWNDDLRRLRANAPARC